MVNLKSVSFISTRMYKSYRFLMNENVSFYRVSSDVGILFMEEAAYKKMVYVRENTSGITNKDEKYFANGNFNVTKVLVNKIASVIMLSGVVLDDVTVY